MADVFSKQAEKWEYNSIVPEILRSTQLPLPLKSATNSLKPDDLSALYAKPQHEAAYWAERTAGFNFSRADQLDASRYNLIQWQGLMGDHVPYPMERDARDLSRNRKALLKKWRQSRLAAARQKVSTPSDAK